MCKGDLKRKAHRAISETRMSNEDYYSMVVTTVGFCDRNGSVNDWFYVLFEKQI